MIGAHLEAPEFIKRVMAGERDFTAIRLTDHDVMGEHYTFLELTEYLKQQDLQKEPIILNEAELEGIRAGGLYMPYLKAQNASFKEAYFYGADFQNGSFARSSFFNTDLQSANCENSDFSNCYFKQTTLTGTKVRGSKFLFADLAAAKDLSSADGLAYAKFGKTTVTAAEAKQILDAVKQRPDGATLETSNYFKTK